MWRFLTGSWVGSWLSVNKSALPFSSSGLIELSGLTVIGWFESARISASTTTSVPDEIEADVV